MRLTLQDAYNSVKRFGGTFRMRFVDGNRNCEGCLQIHNQV